MVLCLRGSPAAEKHTAQSGSHRNSMRAGGSSLCVRSESSRHGRPVSRPSPVRKRKCCLALLRLGAPTLKTC
nr:MAG TPA: hypothetical protein [Caudoviricetes sp.]